MKKVIAVILMILCGFTVVGGGTLFLTSCGTSAEQSGEISDSGEIENPSDDENNTDKPDEDVNSPTDDTTDNGNDTPIEGYGCDYNFTIRTTVYYGTSAVNSSASSSLSSYGTYGGFSVYWRDENGNTAGWGSTTSNGCLRGTMSSAATWYD